MVLLERSDAKSIISGAMRFARLVLRRRAERLWLDGSLFVRSRATQVGVHWPFSVAAKAPTDIGHATGGAWAPD